MVDQTKSLAETYYEEVEALKAEGVANAEAVRQVAEKHGKTENAVRGAIYQYKTRHLSGGGGASRSRRRSPATVDDFVSSARQALEQALELVDREVDEAKVALEAAQARYDEAAASVKDRKADIERKLKALT